MTESKFKITPLWGNFQENSNLLYLHKNCGWYVTVFKYSCWKKYCLHLLETPEFLMLDWNSDSRSENCRLTWFTRCLQVKHSTITGFFQNKTPHISMVKVSTIFLYTCQFSHYYAWVSCLWTEYIDLMYQGQFVTPDSQIRTNCSWPCDDFVSFFEF